MQPSVSSVYTRKNVYAYIKSIRTAISITDMYQVIRCQTVYSEQPGNIKMRILGLEFNVRIYCLVR